MIPVAHPQSEYLSFKAEIDQAIAAVLQNGRYILGPEVSEFEKEFAAYVGVQHAIGVASGTEAIELTLVGAGIEPGDEVITVSHTAVATIAAIHRVGAIPVLVDIEPHFYTLDPALLETALSSKTRAVLAVHLYGQPCDMGAIADFCQRKGLLLLEDCAQAHGARYLSKRVGSMGFASAFSFYPTKNLGAIGDGGMVVTESAEVAERVRSLREYGWKERYVSHARGMNSRLDELQAAILRVKLRHLDDQNNLRQRWAHFYQQGLEGLPFTLPNARAGTEHVYHLFVLESDCRDQLQQKLKERGVGTAIHYPFAVHQQDAYRKITRCPRALPETERAIQRILSLPLYPELGEAHVKKVITEIREAVIPKQAKSEWCDANA
jgi:dTDP-4-amino-4,6-dideoxygalactose transaminase